MAKISVEDKIHFVKARIIQDVNEQLDDRPQALSTFRKIFFDSGTGQTKTGNMKITDLAGRGDEQAREYVLDLIFKLLARYKLTERVLDEILSGYYINYYSNAGSLSTDKTPLLHSKLNKIFIKPNADYLVKLKKLAQLIYQEVYGIGPVDEFLYLGVDENFKKIEEVFAFGPKQLALKISGLNFKLDKLILPNDKIKSIVNRLARNNNVPLSKMNNKVETELLNQFRITLTCPDFNAEHTFNVRLHYPNKLTRAVKIAMGSTTQEYENFLDYIMKFYPRMVYMGGQGTGKTTDLREIFARYPRNTNITTAETAFELALDEIPHIIVNKLRLGVKDPEELLESLFRFNADCLVMGEMRSPSDVMLYSQVTKRQEYGGAGTWHSGDAKEGIFNMGNALVRGGYFKTLEQALVEVCSSVEIVIIKRIADITTKDPGRRHMYQVVEIPKVSQDEALDFEPRVLFEFDYDKMELINRNPISEDLAKILMLRRQDKKSMEVLLSGNYN